MGARNSGAETNEVVLPIFSNTLPARDINRLPSSIKCSRIEKRQYSGECIHHALPWTSKLASAADGIGIYKPRLAREKH